MSKVNISIFILYSLIFEILSTDRISSFPMVYNKVIIMSAQRKTRFYTPQYFMKKKSCFVFNTKKKSINLYFPSLFQDFPFVHDEVFITVNWSNETKATTILFLFMSPL